MNEERILGKKRGKEHPEKRMNRRDIALVILILVASLVGFVLEFIQTGHGAQLQISVNGEVFGVYDLNTDRTVEIGDGNICRIENGSAWMEWADCPDQLCVHHARISRDNEAIVCLPNRVTLTVTDADENSGMDTIVSELSVRQSVQKEKT